MKFLAGVLLGLLLSGPAVHHHYNITETNKYYPAVEDEPFVSFAPESVKIPVVDGDEWCVVELLGGPTADWGAADVLSVLDEAWLNYEGPCDMLERIGNE